MIQHRLQSPKHQQRHREEYQQVSPRIRQTKAFDDIGQHARSQSPTRPLRKSASRLDTASIEIRLGINSALSLWTILFIEQNHHRLVRGSLDGLKLRVGRDDNFVARLH